MEGTKERRQPFFLNNSFLLAFCVVTFTVAVFEGIGGIVMWTHFNAEQNSLRSEFQALKVDYSKIQNTLTDTTEGIICNVYIYEFHVNTINSFVRDR